MNPALIVNRALMVVYALSYPDVVSSLPQNWPAKMWTLSGKMHHEISDEANVAS